MATNLTRWRTGVLTPFDLGALFGPEIRIEQLVNDQQYLIRAEIPGVDAEKEIVLTVADRALRIVVERSEEMRDKTHSEFHYGRFARTVPLPADAMEDTATATYANGILEIGFKLGEPRQPEHRITIEVPKAKK